MFSLQNEKENGNIEDDVMNMVIIFGDHLITYTYIKHQAACLQIHATSFVNYTIVDLEKEGLCPLRPTEAFEGRVGKPNDLFIL